MKRAVAVGLFAFAVLSFTPLTQAQYIGNLSQNQYAPNSTSNPFGVYGSQFSPNSINNRFGIYGSPYSSYSTTNPFAVQAPRIYAQDGQYLGRLSTNRFDPESVSNPFGQYGSQFSPTSINNQFGQYGSQFSPYSPNNPYAISPPVIVGDDE